MNQENKISEEKAASNLKEIYQKFENEHSEEDSNAADQSNTDDVTEQFKGSDADVDRNIGGDDLPDAEDASEQMKGSDADQDR